MKEEGNIIRVLVKGGVISPSELKNVLLAAKKMGNSTIHFGSRQDILFHANDKQVNILETTLAKINIDYIQEKEEQRNQNIVSSYVAAGILPSTNWVTSGTYLWLLEGFNELITLRVNLVDPKQNIVPLFYGHLNFIASPEENYWHLKVKFPGETELVTWPVLVFTDDIHELAYQLEELFNGGEKDVKKLFEQVNATKDYNSKNFKEDVKTPSGFFPYYEGVNRMLSGGRQWIGFYWRNNSYDITFMLELCELCIQTGVAKLCVTPWKSFLVKEISDSDKLLWERLIGRFGINMRHSSVELNWHLPVLDDEALEMKNYLVRRLDQVDVRTFGLTFSIGTKPSDSFTSILIQEESNTLGLRQSYQISVTNNFNLNSTNYKVYETKVSKRQVPNVIIKLCQEYYELLGQEINEVVSEVKEEMSATELVYECGDCGTIYDPVVGDESQGIEKGVVLEDLPIHYKCSLCDAGITEFSAVQMDTNWIR